MNTKTAFGLALKKVRKVKGLTQEDFGDVSSRTYLSTLERGIKSITLEKLNDLAQVLGVHPLTLLVLTYQISKSEDSIDELLNNIKREILDLDSPLIYENGEIK